MCVQKYLVTNGGINSSVAKVGSIDLPAANVYQPPKLVALMLINRWGMV
jgi:hypothetical protein